MMPSSIRFACVFAALSFFVTASLVRANPSEIGKKVAKTFEVPSGSRYLSPGGEIDMPRNLLSLPEERVMALTFDDGPVERDLEISALLKEHDILATFFYIGSKLEARAEIVENVLAAKHEIGFHSYRHKKQSLVSQADLLEDFRLGKAALAALGVPVVWYRPPYGLFNTRVVKTAKEQGMDTILWTVDPRDWSGISAETIAKRVIPKFHPGAVVLFHSNHAATLQALPEIISAAESENYRFVSLSELRNTVQVAHCRVHNRYCPPDRTVGVVANAAFSEEMAAIPAITAAVSSMPGDLAVSPAVSTVLSAASDSMVLASEVADMLTGIPKAVAGTVEASSVSKSVAVVPSAVAVATGVAASAPVSSSATVATPSTASAGAVAVPVAAAPDATGVVVVTAVPAVVGSAATGTTVSAGASVAAESAAIVAPAPMRSSAPATLPVAGSETIAAPAPTGSAAVVAPAVIPGASSAVDAAVAVPVAAVKSSSESVTVVSAVTAAVVPSSAVVVPTPAVAAAMPLVNDLGHVHPKKGVSGKSKRGRHKAPVSLTAPTGDSVRQVLPSPYL